MNLPRRFLGTVAGAALFAVGSTALASETAALYQAYWAGLPAGVIKLVLQDDSGGYRDEIAIRSEGLAWVFMKFRGTAVAEGRVAGCEGETSDEGGPDNAPRPVDIRIADDARLLPLSMQVSVASIPLAVELARSCESSAACAW